MVEKEVFEWIRTGQKTIELRKGMPRQGDERARLGIMWVGRKRRKESTPKTPTFES